MPPPYITSLGLECPPDQLGLNMSMRTNDPDDTVRCPTEVMKQELISAAKDGLVGLWGSPFNQQVSKINHFPLSRWLPADVRI